MCVSEGVWMHVRCRLGKIGLLDDEAIFNLNRKFLQSPHSGNKELNTVPTTGSIRHIETTGFDPASEILSTLS